MEFLLNRFRNLTVLLIALVAQLVLLAYQVKSNSEVRLVRVWAVSAVTPLARVIEAGRAGTVHLIRDYFDLLQIREQNRNIKADFNRTKMENQFLRTELATADRAKSLAIFQRQSPSTTIAAHVVGNTTGVGAKVVIVDRGSGSGVQNGMAVITPDGIVGKVIGVYPAACYVLLITDPSFAAGVISQKNRAHGTVKGQGYSTVVVDYVQNEQKVEPGEQFFTSGEDRIFPKGLPVGEATVVRAGKTYQEIFLTPSGLQSGLEEVLIVIDGVHVSIPDAPSVSQAVHLQDPPPEETPAAEIAPAQPLEQVPAPALAQSAVQPVAPRASQSGALATDADRLVDQYRKIGEAEKHVYGRSAGGAPNFNIHFDSTPGDSVPASAKPANAGQLLPAPPPSLKNPAPPKDP